MAARVVYGNDTSENGWPMVDEQSCEWITVPGTDVRLQIQQGQPLALLRAFAADFNAYVELLRDRDSACWTATNSVATSNHLSGTACDFNWDSHPFRILNAGFTSEQINTIRDLLEFYENTIWWGNDWSEPRDAMHFQVGYDTYGNPHTGDFIKRKIRADGYSTFRRGDAPAVMTVPLTENADGTWTSPSPAWAHLIMRESGGNPTIIQQIIDVNSGGNEAEGLFQITPATWRAHNGTDFAATARAATPQQQALVAARIFTRNPSGSDWGAGLPGREDAQQLAAGLVRVETSTEGVFMALTDAEQRELLDLARQQSAYRRVSRSPLRHVGEGPTETATGFELNVDGNVHVLLVYLLARLGDPDSMNLLREVANLDPTRYADRAHDKQLAQAILNELANDRTPGSAPPTGQVPGTATPPIVVSPVEYQHVTNVTGSGVQSSIAAVDAGLTALKSVVDNVAQQVRS